MKKQSKKIKTVVSKRDKMPNAKATDREVAKFWDTHSVSDYWNELELDELEAKPLPREVVTLRLDPKATKALRLLAKRRGMNYSSLARMWISERLQKELKTKIKQQIGMHSRVV